MIDTVVRVYMMGNLVGLRYSLCSMFYDLMWSILMRNNYALTCVGSVGLSWGSESVGMDQYCADGVV